MDANTARITALATLMLALAAAVYIYAEQQQVRSGVDTAESGRVDGVAPTPVAAPELASSTPARPFGHVVDTTVARASAFADYRCPDARCVQSPFFASSEEDALWMRANGYPSRQQQLEAEPASVTELASRARSGNLADLAIYSKRLADDGQWNASLGVSTRAATLGSIYSLYLISDVLAMSPEKLDPKQSRAFIRAAQLAGDSKATYALVGRFDEFNSPVEQVTVDREAARIHRNLLKNKLSPRPD